MNTKKIKIIILFLLVILCCQFGFAQPNYEKVTSVDLFKSVKLAIDSGYIIYDSDIIVKTDSTLEYKFGYAYPQCEKLKMYCDEPYRVIFNLALNLELFKQFSKKIDQNLYESLLGDERNFNSILENNLFLINSHKIANDSLLNIGQSSKKIINSFVNERMATYSSLKKLILLNDTVTRSEIIVATFCSDYKGTSIQIVKALYFIPSVTNPDNLLWIDVDCDNKIKIDAGLWTVRTKLLNQKSWKYQNKLFQYSTMYKFN